MKTETVPALVMFSDGNLYQDPVIRGSDWFLSFEDQDPAELVIRRLKIGESDLLGQRADNILRVNGIESYCEWSQPLHSGFRRRW